MIPLTQKEVNDMVQFEDAEKEGIGHDIERTRTIVLNMHAKQIPTEVIAEFIGVPFENVQIIIEENSR